MNHWITAGVLASVLAVSGCGKLAAPSGSVAVIDLDKVATAMGWMEEMTKSFKTADTELRGQLDEIGRNTLKAIDDVKKQVAAEAKLTDEQTKILVNAKEQRELEGLPLSKEQRQRLLETVNKANIAWQTALNNYQQALQTRRANLVLTYRDKVRPSVRRVAAARGMTVVLTTSDNLLYFDPQSASITDKVIDELQRSLSEEKSASTAATPSSGSGTGK